ncbi:MAG: pyruvate formate-lyase-activating protein [Candidatus Omnitrophota bacterium]
MKTCKDRDNSSGRIHSFESFSTLDGPGIRYVVFMQGCLGRCIYCQNPDTWKLNAGDLYTAKEVFHKIEKCIPYMASSNGGVTLSGGEPLLQPDFIIELFKLCRASSIHTTIDTSAFYAKSLSKEKLDKITALTGLFMVDLKASSKKLHKDITGREMGEAVSFIEDLEEKKKPYWIRYVLVPGLNDSEKDISGLKEILSTLRYCKNFEFLPYHTLGNHKWSHLGLKYRLKDTPPAAKEDIKKAEKLLS